jgi:hypothetical protein
MEFDKRSSLLEKSFMIHAPRVAETGNQPCINQNKYVNNYWACSINHQRFLIYGKWTDFMES